MFSTQVALYMKIIFYCILLNSNTSISHNSSLSILIFIFLCPQLFFLVFLLLHFLSSSPQLISTSLLCSMPEKVCKFQGQCYHKLKRSCLRRRALFQDPIFPPSAESLFYKRTPPPGLTWRRPRVRETDSERSLCILNVFVLIVNFVNF